MEDIARGAFWLAVGIVIAAAIIADALKKRAREHETQVTLREMMRLEAEGKSAPETLKYIRERDEADRLAAAQAATETSGDRVGAFILAFIVGLVSFVAGLAVFALPIRAMGGPTTLSVLISVVALLIVWVGGGRLAVLTYRTMLGRKKEREKGPRPGA